jgi:hypothetical protein
MPQRASRPPLVTTLTQQATKALAALRQEITQRERELAALKAEVARWQSVMRPPARGVGTAVTFPRVPSSKRPRLDWSAILKELPTRFTTQDVAQKAGKPIGHVYVYVSRWMKDKKVRKVKEGYQKVSRRV